MWHSIILHHLPLDNFITLKQLYIQTWNQYVQPLNPPIHPHLCMSNIPCWSYYGHVIANTTIRPEDHVVTFPSNSPCNPTCMIVTHAHIAIMPCDWLFLLYKAFLLIIIKKWPMHGGWAEIYMGCAVVPGVSWGVALGGGPSVKWNVSERPQKNQT